MLQADTYFHDRYRLIEKLGYGGFSEVWKTRDLRSEVVVALKIFTRMDKEGVTLCRNEFIKTHDLHHVNILRPFHFDIYNERPYLVMPFMSGGTAAKLVGKLTGKQTEMFIEQIGSALDYIHNRTNPIIHGDIKPDNILLDGEGNFLLTDFGISREFKQRLTHTIGAHDYYEESGITPMAYRPPELYKYKDWVRYGLMPKSDIWSFGATLYYLVTGALPFNGEGGLGQLVMMKSGGISMNNALELRLVKQKSNIEAFRQWLQLYPKNRPGTIYKIKENGSSLRIPETVNVDPKYLGHKIKDISTSLSNKKPEVLLALLSFFIAISFFSWLLGDTKPNKSEIAIVNDASTFFDIDPEIKIVDSIHNFEWENMGIDTVATETTYQNYFIESDIDSRNAKISISDEEINLNEKFDIRNSQLEDNKFKSNTPVNLKLKGSVSDVLVSDFRTERIINYISAKDILNSKIELKLTPVVNLKTSESPELINKEIDFILRNTIAIRDTYIFKKGDVVNGSIVKANKNAGVESNYVLIKFSKLIAGDGSIIEFANLILKEKKNDPRNKNILDIGQEYTISFNGRQEYYFKKFILRKFK